jgi:hypothetical protein
MQTYSMGISDAYLRLVKLIDFSAWFGIMANAAFCQKNIIVFHLLKDIITLSNSWQQVGFHSVTRLDFLFLCFRSNSQQGFGGLCFF